MIKTIADMIHAAKANRAKPLVVAKANDEHVLKAVKAAHEEDLVNAVLIDGKDALVQSMRGLGMDPKDYTLIDESDNVKACIKAVREVRKDPQSILMKGLVDTSTILKAALNKEAGLRTKNRLSHVSVLETKNYHKLLLMSDGAMNIAPDATIKQEIIENAVEVAASLGIRPANVGIIAAVEKVTDKMPATLDAGALKALTIDGAVIDGPFALDNAIDKEAATHKGIDSPIAGDIDILLMPAIETGNVFYKTMMFLCNAKSASLIAGATHPIVLTSRADSFETKFHSIALAALDAASK
ncbi:MAG: phosphate acyltransferase [Candidatus Izemoplasmataceae bacterium]